MTLDQWADSQVEGFFNELYDGRRMEEDAAKKKEDERRVLRREAQAAVRAVERRKRLRRRRFEPSSRNIRHPCLLLHLSLPQLLTLGLDRRMYYRTASAALWSGNPATVPHSGTRVSLPSHWPLRRAASPHRCPSRFIGSLAGCTFPFPPFRFCSLCSSALPACQID